MRQSLLRYLPVSLPLAIFWLIGIAGLDYGSHWDEPKLLESVRVSVYEGVYLPTFYNYPSVSHALGVLSALPEITRNIGRNHLNEPVFHGHIAAFQLDNHVITLRTRLVFLTITSLAIIWLYGLMLSWRGSMWVALFSSSVLAFSWEVVYHARWIAPDTILMQFGALFLLCLVQAYRHPNKQYWLWLTVIAAGLATGTKYPAGLLLLPVLVLVWWHRQSRFSLVQAIFVFAITYLITTPGTLLQPFKFWYQVEFEMWHYSFGHSKHTVSAGAEHLLKNLEYLTTVQLSHFSWIGMLFFTCAIVGGIVLWRESKRLACIVLLFPILYLVFMSLQRAMLIRNLLVLVPFIAVLCGIGVQWLWQFVQHRWLRIVLIVMIVSLSSVNVGWLIYTTETIKDRDTDQYLDDLRTWVEQFPDITYFASEHVRGNLGADISDNITPDLSQADEVLVYLSEIQEIEPMPANIPRLFTWRFGSWETNIEYYTWHGDDKVVLLPIETVQYYDLTPYLENQ